MKPLHVLVLLLPVLVPAQEEPLWPVLSAAADATPLPNTAQLDWEGDLASRMVEGVDQFLLTEIEASVEKRAARWKRDASSPEAYAKSVEPNRERLAKILGIPRDARPEKPDFEYVDWTPEPRAEGEGFVVRQVRWLAFGEVHGIGLLFEPDDTPVADVIALPDADQTPEEISSLPPFGLPKTNAYALQLARAGCRVLVPTLINRQDHEKYSLSNREWLNRPAYELGRTLAGYETQKILAAVDCLLAMPRSSSRKIAVAGWGEGGRLALYAAALDQRIDAACVSGYFAPRQKVWDEPADRTVFRLLNEFGDAEIASLVAPRALIVEHSAHPSFVFRADESGEPERLAERAKKAGKPGKLIAPSLTEAEAEFGRLQQQLGALAASAAFVQSDSVLADSTLREFLSACGADAKIPPPSDSPYDKAVAKIGDHDLVAERHAAQVREINQHNQWALIDSRRVRAELFADLKTDSLEAFEGDIERFRDLFRDDVIGKFDQQLLAGNPRTRKYQEGPKTISYEVVLDVFPGVFAYGILTLPKDFDIASGERRPVVVCQHGLEGRPQDVVGEAGFQYYSAFATRLAERGFVTFAPQNIYIFHDRFRTLQFKANAVGCTLFSIMVPQHQQITGWLASQPFVDPDRIAFYGLSYGGKSAMRIPPLVDNYCLSICSADFNEWVWKNTATDPKSDRYTYVGKGEYEIFEFDLGGTFNYAEMAALICPKPFMVERGHFDGVAPDEAVAYEFAKVRHLYQAKLGIGDRTEIGWFVGPHSIDGKATYDFLHRHLGWPKPQE